MLRRDDPEEESRGALQGPFFSAQSVNECFPLPSGATPHQREQALRNDPTVSDDGYCIARMRRQTRFGTLEGRTLVPQFRVLGISEGVVRKASPNEV